MTKSIFEQMGGTYTQQGDYLLPDLKLPEQEETNIGIWGMRYRQWLKATHRVLYYNLLTKGELNECLAEADERAENMFSQLVSEIAEREGEYSARDCAPQPLKLSIHSGGIEHPCRCR